MKEKMKRILDTFHKYNVDNMAYLVFGLDAGVVYDALVIAPDFSPYKLKLDEYCEVTTLREGSYVAGYLVEKDGLKIAWVKVSSSETNFIDHGAVCSELQFKKMIFIGSVGALKPSFELGDICTPAYSISGGCIHNYLKESIHDQVPFEKVVPTDMDFIEKVVALGEAEGCEVRKASVFCTPTIALEYYHLDEIRAFDTDLIEMETAAFYLLADILEIPGVALLVVSDNSSTGEALVGRTDEQQAKYDKGRMVELPKMILATAKME